MSERRYLAFALLLASLFLAGCSHRVLTFFFTGVPDPNQPVNVAEDLAAAETAPAYWQDYKSVPQQRFFAHGPWANKQCDSCHEPSRQGAASVIPRSGESAPDGSVCLDCHVQQNFAVAAEGLWVHGPVASRQCTACHNPHSSGRMFMLQASDNNQLCGSCHINSEMSAKHTSTEGADCASCHDPHAAANRLLLKAGAVQ